MKEMTCDEWQQTKYFGSLTISSELIDLSLLILALDGA